jgi:hypothetical protein
MESAFAIRAAALLRSKTVLFESGLSSIVADTRTAARVACRGTRTNAMSEAMNTSPPTIPIIANRREAFRDLDEVHQ